MWFAGFSHSYQQHPWMVSLAVRLLQYSEIEEYNSSNENQKLLLDEEMKKNKRKNPFYPVATLVKDLPNINIKAVRARKFKLDCSFVQFNHVFFKTDFDVGGRICGMKKGCGGREVSQKTISHPSP